MTTCIAVSMSHARMPFLAVVSCSACCLLGEGMQSAYAMAQVPSPRRHGALPGAVLYTSSAKRACIGLNTHQGPIKGMWQAQVISNAVCNDTLMFGSNTALTCI